MLDILPTAKAGEKKNRDHEHVATVLKLPAKGGDRQDRMYKRADIIFLFTPPARAATLRKVFYPAGKRKRFENPPDPFPIVQFLFYAIRTNTQAKKAKRNPLAPNDRARGFHVERRKLHLCSAAHLSAATVIDGSKVLVSTPHRLTRSSSMTPSSLYLLPSIMYYTTNRTFLQVFSQN